MLQQSTAPFGVHGSVHGSVIGQSSFQKNPPGAPNHPHKNLPPEASLPRAMNYYADYSGCGFWRMLWPENILCAYQKAVVSGTTVMCTEPSFYSHTRSVRIQRQASPHQLKFVQFLRNLADKNGFQLIYEIDDIMFKEDIPEYNKFKFAFEDPAVRKASQDIMAMCDEVTVTCEYMKDYYKAKTGNNNITVIPNYPPRFWLDGYFDEETVSKNYDRCMKKRKKPRVLYAGSGAHFDVGNKTNHNDDFAHVIETIRKTVNKIDWVFIGGFPLPLTSLVKSGKIEFHNWTQLYECPRLVERLKVNCMVAPLQDNTFNRAKSDIKYVEACAFGLPIACQDMVTYEKAPHKFTTGDEMIDQINNFMSDKQEYMKISRKGYQYARTRWLENNDNINKYLELYTLPYSDPKRLLLNKTNNI